MAESPVQGGVTGGPAPIACVTSAGGNRQQLIAVSPQGSDADVFGGSPTIGTGIRIGLSRYGPSSTLTRPANTNAYAANSLVASSVTAGAVVVSSFAGALANGGSGVVRSLRLRTNVATGMDGATFLVDLWNAAPTFNVGDGGIYGTSPSGTPGIATGSASWLGSFTFSGAGQFREMGDGSIGWAAPDVGSDMSYVCGASSTLLYWTLMTTFAFTPIASQLFIVTAFLVQD